MMTKKHWEIIEDEESWLSEIKKLTQVKIFKRQKNSD